MHWNVANKLTLLRLITAPVFALFFYLADPMLDGAGSYKAGAVPLIILLAITLFQDFTDMIDGVIARKSGTITDTGKIFDPFADSVCHLTSFLCMLAWDIVPLWFFLILFYREAAVWNLRIAAAKMNVLISARATGKLKAVVQGGAINIILFMLVLSIAGFNFPAGLLIEIIVIITASVTLFSLYDYLRAGLKILKRQ